jgi:hypothetical protein
MTSVITWGAADVEAASTSVTVALNPDEDDIRS